jgi:hypothetical protein
MIRPESLRGLRKYAIFDFDKELLIFWWQGSDGMGSAFFATVLLWELWVLGKP